MILPKILNSVDPWDIKGLSFVNKEGHGSNEEDPDRAFFGEDAVVRVLAKNGGVFFVLWLCEKLVKNFSNFLKFELLHILLIQVLQDVSLHRVVVHLVHVYRNCSFNLAEVREVAGVHFSDFLIFIVLVFLLDFII